MKKTLSLLSILLILASCNKEDASTLQNIASDENLSTTALAETLDKLYLDEDISTMIQSSDLIINNTTNKASTTLKNEGITSIGINEEAHGRNGQHGGQGQGAHHFEEDEYGSCAVVTIDTIANTKLIDFGTGCSDDHGESRSGQILISYSSDTDVVGSYRQVEFINFFRDSINIQGTRRMEVIDIDANGNSTTKTSLVNGKMIYADGTFETKNSVMTRFEYKDENDRSLNYSTVFGTESGVDSEGVSFSMEITTPIKFVRNCADFIDSSTMSSTLAGQGRHNGYRHGKKIPVEGVKVLTTGEDIVTIDFGDGTCDTTAEVTTNGVTETVDVSTLPRGNAFGKLFHKGKGH